MQGDDRVDKVKSQMLKDFAYYLVDRRQEYAEVRDAHIWWEELQRQVWNLKCL